MPIERYKDVEIKGFTVRIERVPADVGNWIVARLASGDQAGEETYQKLCGHLFSRMKVMKGDMPQLLYANGKFLVPELELDIDLEAFNDLWRKAMDFNFGPFFEKRMQEAMEAAASAASLSTTKP